MTLTRLTILISASSSRHAAITARSFRTFLVILLLSMTLPVSAQSPGQITGVVRDPQQGPLIGAQVILTDPQTKAKTTAVTNEQGVYIVSLLSPGLYTLEAQIAEDLRRGSLRLVLEQYAAAVPGFFLYFPSRAQVSPALRAFVSVAREVIAQSTANARR